MTARVQEDARLLETGALPLHAAAFAWRGAGWAVTGASGAGKTGVLLAFLSRGAAYLAADRIVVSANGAELVGLREPVRVRAWHARQLPGVRGALDMRTRIRFAALGAPGATLEALPDAVLATAAFRRLAPWVRRFDRRVFADLDPTTFLGPVGATARAPFAALLLLERVPDRRTRVIRLDPGAAVAALAPLMEKEFSPLPVGGAVRAALERTLCDRPVLRVEHAYGGALDELVDVVLDGMACAGGSECASST